MNFIAKSEMRDARSVCLPNVSKELRQATQLGNRTSTFLLGITKAGLTAENPPASAVALYRGIGSSSLNALVKAFEKLQVMTCHRALENVSSPNVISRARCVQ
jgi:hypothetical protein